MSQSPFITPELKAVVDAEIGKVLPEVVRFRHERHAHPELTWREVETAKAIAAKLKTLPGLTVQEGVGRLGIVAILEGDAPGPTVALRADMDALPVKEDSGRPYASCNPGVMHACGHDGHMANLLGAAMVLTKMRSRIKGKVKLIFQPAEEGGAGADVMCKDGALENPKVDVIFGLHGWPELECGHVYVKSGAMLAATTEIKITIRGRGCHAATAHLGTDQILVGARLVDALQSVASRTVAPTEPIALSITKFHGGTAINVIPSEVELGGTLRTLSVATRDRCEAEMRRLTAGIAAAHGVEIELELKHGYPPTVNDFASTNFVEQIGQALLSEGRVKRMPAPSMGGEDFAYFLQRIPGAYFLLGMDDGRKGGYPSLHHPGYDFNDAALPVGMAMFVHAALAYADWRPS